MFVTCGKCNAEYELDDAKIPAGGARLRCTNCDHSFVIAPPEASDPQSADDLAHDALSTEAPAGADPDPEEEAAPEEDFDPDEESDWEFNEEIHYSEPEADEEIGFSKPEANEEIGFSEPEANEEIGFAEPEEGGDETEPAFDQSGDWSDFSTAEDVADELPQSSVPVEAGAAAGADDLLGEIGVADSRLGESTGDSASGSEFSSEGVDRGEPAAIAGSAGDSAADGSDSFADLSDLGLGDKPAEADAPAAVARSGTRAEPQVEIAVAMAHDSPTTIRWTDRILAIVGWGAVSLMMIVALVGGLAPNWSDARATAGSWSGAGFEADQIVGRWVDNAVAGSIYVVSGRIRLAPGSDRTSRKTLGIRLIDATGREIDRAPIPLAPTVPERILRESSPSELDAFQARRAGRITAAGERWVSFEAVLTDLPRSADRFELQGLDR